MVHEKIGKSDGIGNNPDKLRNREGKGFPSTQGGLATLKTPYIFDGVNRQSGRKNNEKDGPVMVSLALVCATGALPVNLESTPMTALNLGGSHAHTDCRR